jgi:phosphoenolpyruvate-protein phosphotransferase
MGPAWIAEDVARDSFRRAIAASDVPGELERIRSALDGTRAELDAAALRVEQQLNSDLADIFRSHQMLLDSLLRSQEFERELRETLRGGEEVVHRVFRRWYEKLRAVQDETLRQRADDIADVGRKVLRQLTGQGGGREAAMPAGSVLVAERLLPSDVVSLVRGRVTAVVVQSLGQGAHAALLVREKNIPTVAGVPDLFARIEGGSELLVDATRGEVIADADESTRAQFQERLARYLAASVACRGACQKPACTRDGRRVAVEANVGTFEDVQTALDHGADGVGLCRIEQLYLARRAPPDEEELLEELRRIAAPFRGKPFTVRLLDVGGDKVLSYVRLAAGGNPLLGKRGVRLLLEQRTLACTQLRALLQLFQEQPIEVLVPMITLEEDIVAVRELLADVTAEMGLDAAPPLGAMIETPAAALNVPAIVPHVDFLSVGTNDLTQYTLAAGRDDPEVDRYFQQHHASVLRLLRIIAEEAGSRPVTICGELAGREALVPDLLAMGFRALSMAPPLIPGVKAVVRGVDLSKS